MIEQRDVDQLLNELKTIRKQLFRDREAARQQLDAVLARAQTMRDEAAGGKFEACVTSVHDLLTSLRRGVESRARRDSMAA